LSTTTKQHFLLHLINCMVLASNEPHLQLYQFSKYM